MPRRECDLSTPPHRYLSTEGGAGGTSSIGIRSVFWEGWYVRQTDTPQNTPGGIAEGLRRAFPLPASGAFQDLVEALDRVGAQKSAPGEREKS
jgi:hypothetical protein